MPRTLRVAALQLPAHDRAAFSQAWPSVAAAVRHAAARGSQLIVLPEGTLPAYVLAYEPFDAAEIAVALAELRAVAADAGAVIVAGCARSDGGRAYNSAVVIDADGSIAGYADKQFLWHFDRQWYARGEHCAPVRTAAGTLGVMICADGRIPTIARTLVDRGAELLVMPTAWVTSGRDPDVLENVQADLLAAVRARENGVPFIAANKSGVERGCVAYCGKSQILRADGTVLALAPQDGAHRLYAELEFNGTAPYRCSADPVAAAPAAPHSVRVALAARPLQAIDSLDERLRILECATALGPVGETHGEPFHAHAVDDGRVLDPGGVAALREAGADCIVWTTRLEMPWQERFARARALELRMYVIVVDAQSERAYAVDPDGGVLCGTFAAYELASFIYDPQRPRQTLVAPGTDVAQGLRDLRALRERV